MKLTSKLKLSTVISIAVIMGSSGQAMASQTPIDVNVHQVPMHFTFDGKEYAPSTDQQGFLYEGSTYVPLRFISYALNKAVKWDSATYTVTIEEPNDTDKITIGEFKLNAEVRTQSNAKVDVSKLTERTLQVYQEKVTYVFDGAKKAPSEALPGYIIDGSLFVPMRFVAESIGKTIDWDPNTYTVSAVTKPGEKKPEVKTPEVPKPSPTPAAGGGGAVGGGGGGGGGGSAGGGSSKPSLESIKSDTEAKLLQLKSQSSTELHDLYNQYLSTKDPALISQAWEKVSQADSAFEQIMNETNSKLVSNGYDTSIIDEYRAEYEKIKSDAQDEILPN